MKSSQEFKKAIQEYLEQRAKEDGLFAVSYAKANKSIDECCNYILSTVHKSGCNGFTDAEIYGMAVHYYDEDNIKDVKPVNSRVVVNRMPELAPVQLQQKKEPAKRKRTLKKELEDSRQMSLF